MAVQFNNDFVLQYFENAVEVQFYYCSEWRLGIGYHDVVIDCEDGEVIPVVEILAEGKQIQIYNGWASLYF